jgi:hypothetical protein
MLSGVVECGGVLRRVTTSPRETKATITISSELSRSEFLDRLSNYYPEAALHSADDRDQYLEPPRKLTAEGATEILDVAQQRFPTTSVNHRGGYSRQYSTDTNDI